MTWRYEIHGWHRTGDLVEPPGFILRPGSSTVALRLRVTLVLVVLSAGVWAISIFVIGLANWNPPSTFKAPPTDPATEKRIADIEQHLSPAARKRIDEADAARQQRFADRASSNHQKLLVLHRVSWLVIAILLLGALAAPISASWNRLVVTSPQPGILQLVETGLWPRTRRIRLADYGAPVLTQYEFRSPGSGYGTPMPPTRSWGWILVLPPIVSSAPTIEFWLRARKHPTAADDPPAEEIAEFVDPLKKLIALSSSRIHPSS